MELKIYGISANHHRSGNSSGMDTRTTNVRVSTYRNGDDCQVWFQAYVGGDLKGRMFNMFLTRRALLQLTEKVLAEQD